MRTRLRRPTDLLPLAATVLALLNGLPAGEEESAQQRVHEHGSVTPNVAVEPCQY
ncbi:MAG: hypothetical protein KF790_11420 [Steroidobacteraceae bacterium]|nr:hypothetical protein [Steroidobacteraceae bacterium]MCW5572641.1 hypothetical protein [Steroidobacteraceae bacterium]